MRRAQSPEEQNVAAASFADVLVYHHAEGFGSRAFSVPAVFFGRGTLLAE